MRSVQIIQKADRKNDQKIFCHTDTEMLGRIYNAYNRRRDIADT